MKRCHPLTPDGKAASNKVNRSQGSGHQHFTLRKFSAGKSMLTLIKVVYMVERI
jgi:hypothetical protein